MLSNIKNVFSLILRDKNILFKRNNLPHTQVIFNIRSKQSVASPEEQYRTSETDNKNITDQPIKYSSSRAATMKINEYRDPYGDSVPWYQPYSVLASISVFLIYFCILREENDIDLILSYELGDSLKQFDNKLAERKAATK